MTANTSAIVNSNAPAKKTAPSFDHSTLHNNELIARHLEWCPTQDKFYVHHKIHADPFLYFRIPNNVNFTPTVYPPQPNQRIIRPEWVPASIPEGQWNLAEFSYWTRKVMLANDVRLRTDDLLDILLLFRPDLHSKILDRYAQLRQVTILSLEPLRKPPLIPPNNFGYEPNELAKLTWQLDIIPNLYHFFALATVKCISLGIHNALKAETQKYTQHQRKINQAKERKALGKRRLQEFRCLRESLMNQMKNALKGAKVAKNAKTTKNASKYATAPILSGEDLDGDELDLLQIMRPDLFQKVVREYAVRLKVQPYTLDYLYNGLRTPKMFGFESEFYDEFTWEDDILPDLECYMTLVVNRAERMGLKRGLPGGSIHNQEPQETTVKVNNTTGDYLDKLQKLRPDLFNDLLNSFCVKYKVSANHSKLLKGGFREPVFDGFEDEFYPDFTWEDDIEPELSIYYALIVARGMRLRLPFAQNIHLENGI